MAKEGGGDVLFAHLRSPDLSPFGSGIFHARPHSCPYHRQFQLTEHTCHLEKCFAHGVSLTIATIQSNGANDDQPQVLLPHKVDDFTELLCASGKAGHFQHNDAVARLGFRKHCLLLALDLGIAMLILHKNLLGSRSFQFAGLARYAGSDRGNAAGMGRRRAAAFPAETCLIFALSRGSIETKSGETDSVGDQQPGEKPIRLDRENRKMPGKIRLRGPPRVCGGVFP